MSVLILPSQREVTSLLQWVDNSQRTLVRFEVLRIPSSVPLACCYETGVSIYPLGSRWVNVFWLAVNRAGALCCVGGNSPKMPHESIMAGRMSLKRRMRSSP